MTKKLLTILLLTLSTISWAQDKDSDKFNQALNYVDQMEYEKAYDCFNEARPTNMNYPRSVSKKKIQEREMNCLIHMGECSYLMENYEQSLVHYNQAITIARLLGDNAIEYNLLSEMKLVYQKQYEDQKVMMVNSKMDSINRLPLKSPSLEYEISFSLAKDAESQNNFPMAESAYLDCENLLDKIPSDTKKTKEIALFVKLSDLYEYYMKEYVKAIRYLNQLIEVYKGRKTRTDSIYAYSYYGNMAQNHAKLGQMEKAIAALDSARYGIEKYNVNDPMSLLSYHVYARGVYQAQKDWVKTAEENKAGLKIVEKIGDKSLTLQFMQALAGALFQLGNYPESRDLYQKSCVMVKDLYGENRLEYAEALKYLANVEGFCDDFVYGEQHYADSYKIMRGIVENRLKFVSLEEREAFWGQFSPSLWKMTAYALKAGNVQDSFTKECYEALLFSKAFLLESDRTISDAFNLDCTAEERELYNKYLELSQQRNTLRKNPYKNKELIDSLNVSINTLNRQLTEIISKLGFSKFTSFNYDEVKALLKNNEVLIDFSDFFSDQKVTQHVAYAINNKQEFPVLLKYVTTEDVITLLDGLPIDRIHDARLQEKVREMFWNPLSPYVAGKKTIFYVPSGILHQIALESIPMGDGSMLGEHYNFVRLTSAREIERYKSNLAISHKSNALLYGGLKYSLDNATMKLASAKYETPKLFAMRGTLRGDSIFHELPYALEEVTGTKKILDKRGVHAEVLSGADGTEESFISLDGKAPQILHLSTHGFYYTPEQASDVAYLNGYKDAMALSGLILSGGNAAWLGKELPQNVLGGVLTANTIARLDLKGIDLLFLAACQTGNGKVTPEGIFGLQRAFKKAGVKTIVMSLWDVDDKVAKEFSIRFYKELTRNGWDKRRAFEKAKSRIRKMKDYKEPFYWAGFVMLD